MSNLHYALHQIEYQLSNDGLFTTVKDITDWDSHGSPRSDYVVIAGLLKWGTSGFAPCTVESGSFYNVSDEQPEFLFRNRNDGYYKVRNVYALKNSAPSVEGSVYFNTSTNKIFLYTNGSFSEVSYTNLLLYNGDLSDEFQFNLGFSPSLEKAIDKIWYEYYKSRRVHDGKDYDNFSILYALLIGARSSLLEGNFTEFDSKIDNAYKIALRKLKEIK